MNIILKYAISFLMYMFYYSFVILKIINNRSSHQVLDRSYSLVNVEKVW